MYIAFINIFKEFHRIRAVDYCLPDGTGIFVLDRFHEKLIAFPQYAARQASLNASDTV